ncbi:MAG: hypothetical protein KatS3mg014_0682 [Actinomycetota bacterium]|nr:MAG: hypothetical protein KatS3mg014_0682 [Actinomycetota bacterium]
MSPSRDPDASDPMEIVGVVLDRPMDLAGLEAMARTFIEEYALMGWPPKRILDVFRRPFYAGAHDAYEALGEARVRALIAETYGLEEGWAGA